MKMRCLLGVSMGLLASASLVWGADLPWETQLPFQEATIHYQLSGSQQGEEILYIKNSGRLRAKYHKGSTTIMGMTNTTETVEILDPDWVATYDLVAKTGSKTTNPGKLYQAEYNRLSSSEKKNFVKNTREFGVGMMVQFGGAVTRGSGTVLGYDCDVISVNNGMSIISLLRNTDIPLRSEISAMGMKDVNVATKIDTRSAVPDSVFAPPVGISTSLDQQAEEMMAGMVRQTVASLKEPDGAQKMRQQAGAASMAAPAQPPAMKIEGISADEQQEMMRQMQGAMEQMQNMQKMQRN